MVLHAQVLNKVLIPQKSYGSTNCWKRFTLVMTLPWPPKSLDLNPIRQLWGCSGQTTRIHGSQTSQLTRLKGSAANVLVPATTSEVLLRWHKGDRVMADRRSIVNKHLLIKSTTHIFEPVMSEPCCKWKTSSGQSQLLSIKQTPQWYKCF